MSSRNATHAIESPGAEDLYSIGAGVKIHKSVRMPDGSIRLVVQGSFRFRVLQVVQVPPYVQADIEILNDIEPAEDAIEIDALTRNVHSVFSKVVELSNHLSDEVGSLASAINDGGRLGDFVAQNLPSLDTPTRQAVLETLEVKSEFAQIHEALLRELEVLELGNKIESTVKSEVGKTQREYYLREQMKAIQKELGETDEDAKEIEELRRKDRRSGHAGRCQERSAQGAQSLVQDSAGIGRVHRRTHLPGLDRSRPLEQADRGRLRHPQSQGHPGRRITTIWKRSRIASWSSWQFSK